MLELSSSVLLAWNTGITVIMFLVSLIVKNYRDQFEQHKAEDAEVKLRLSRIELLVAGEYVTRSEFKEEINKVEAAVNELAKGIYAKLDGYERARRSTDKS